MKKLACLWALVLTIMYGDAQTGLLLSTFGNNGAAITPIGAGKDEGRNLYVQPDGKIVVVGDAFNGSNFDFAVARYNTNGTLDGSFGTGGIVMTDIAGGDDMAYAVIVQGDGKIVVAGDGKLTNSDFAVVRYLPNGTLDPSFDGDGIATIDFGGVGSDDHVNYMLIQPDGKLVVNGYRNYGSNGDFAVIRLNTDGSLDGTFGGGTGKVYTDINGGSEDFSSGVLYQPDGKLILCGSTGGGQEYDFAAVRYNPNGTLDLSFGNNGKIFYSIGHDDHCYASALQTDGKIVMVGWGDVVPNEDDFVTVRLLPNGNLDLAFGTGGIVRTNIGPGVTDDQAIGTAIQSDGKIVVIGNSSNGDFNVVRYKTDGSLDNSFANNGVSVADISSGQNDNPRKVRLHGMVIYVAGWSIIGGNYDFALAAFQNDVLTSLPLLMTRFVVERRSNDVLLEWNTTNEVDIEQFVVERSSDGVNYTAIGKVARDASASLNKRYSFVDGNPLPGRDYYRISIRNLDGSRELSRVVSIRLDNMGKGLQIFPNPVADQLQIQVPAGLKGKLAVQVLDAAGKVVRSMQLISSGNMLATAIPVGMLNKGLYHLRILGASETLTASFLKQ